MAIAFVSSVSAASGVNGGTTGSFDTTGANLIVVCVTWYAPAGEPTVSDNKGNTYVQLTSAAHISPKSRIFYKAGAAVGTGHTITVTGSLIYNSVVAYAFSGVSNYEQEIGSVSSGTPHASGSVTPGRNGALIFASLGSETTATDVAPSGFSGLVTVPYVGSVNMQTSGAYLIQTTAAAVNPTWTWTGGTHNAVARVAVFLPTTTGIAFISSGSGKLNTSTATTSAFDSTNANLIVVSASSYAPSPVPTISDNKGNTYTALTVHSAADPRNKLFYILNPIVGGGHTVTASTATGYPTVHAYAFSGVDSYHSENGAINTVSPLACGNVTPSTNGSLIFTGLGSDTSVTDVVPTGFTGPATVVFASGTNMQGSAAYLIQTTAATINPTWTWAGVHEGATSVAVFTPTSTAAGRVSQLPVEVGILSDAPVQLRLSQLPVEVGILSNIPITLRLSQLPIEVLIDTSIIPSTSTETTQFLIVMP